ncbi:MAG: hypothetical protein NVSMB17_06630 [Candidatus Dormibacteria bacterium]
MSDLATTLWWSSLAIGLVVTIVAAVLLTLVLRTARDIDAGAKLVWTEGKMVARNTIHIPDLIQTNQMVADILEGAGAIVMDARRVRGHAEKCTGCPACLLSGARS